VLVAITFFCLGTQNFTCIIFSHEAILEDRSHALRMMAQTVDAGQVPDDPRAFFFSDLDH
jgi:hypothetical protein